MPTNRIKDDSEAEKRKLYFARQYQQYQEFLKNKASNQHGVQGEAKPHSLVVGKSSGASDQQGSIFTQDLYKNKDKCSVNPAILKNIIKSQAGSSVADAQVNNIKRY